MARLRTVKPEFWTSEQVMECSPITRLLFIGLWNFCDDGGNHPASSVTLRAEVFPGDKHPVSTDDVQKCITELLEHALIVEYEANNKRYWHVTGWHHQKIDKPTFKYPKPQNQGAIAEDSGSNQGAIADTSRRRGEERNGDETNGAETNKPSSDDDGSAQPSADHQPSQTDNPNSAKPNCPHTEIIALYHEILPSCPAIRDWTPTRATALRARWNESSERQSLEYWRGLFEYIAGIPFLTGNKSGSNGRAFFADLPWIVKAENFAKIREGRYEERAA